MSSILQESIPVSSSALVIYFHVGALSVLIWDVASHIKCDYDLLVSDFCIKTFLYLLSRTMTFLYALTKVIYITTPSNMCSILDHTLAGFYVVALFATLFLSTLHMALLMDKQRWVVITALSCCTLVVGGNIIFPFGVSGANPPQLSQPRACQESVHDYIGAAFILLCAYHAVMLIILTIAARLPTLNDRENLSSQERYNHRKSSMLTLTRPPTMEHYIFYTLTTILSLGMTIWFFVTRQSSGSFRLIPVVVYLVCANITLGRVLRANKRVEKERRMSEAFSAPIKLEMPRMGGTHSSPMESTEPTKSFNGPNDNIQSTQCDVLGLFEADSASCIPPVVEIEVNRVVQSKRDYAEIQVR